ncbi:MAG: ribonuclease P protein component [Clostridia bacterium]|nr:ribonuclease P protein component [Clostridia bacterium]
MQYLRLKKQADYQRLFKKGKRAFSSSLSIIYVPCEHMRMGLSIGKKHGKSVQRNRIKRLLRESFRACQGEFSKNYSVIIIPKVCSEYSLNTYVRDLKWMIKREKL